MMLMLQSFELTQQNVKSYTIYKIINTVLNQQTQHLHQLTSNLILLYFKACYLSHFEESHSSKKRITASLMLWSHPLQLQLICYFLQTSFQVLAAFHQVL